MGQYNDKSILDQRSNMGLKITSYFTFLDIYNILQLQGDVPVGGSGGPEKGPLCWGFMFRKVVHRR